ncbi:hypothetical protein BST61_g8508 [Cercospora zeina]
MKQPQVDPSSSYSKFSTAQLLPRPFIHLQHRHPPRHRTQCALVTKAKYAVKDLMPSALPSAPHNLNDFKMEENLNPKPSRPISTFTHFAFAHPFVIALSPHPNNRIHYRRYGHRRHDRSVPTLPPGLQ